MCSTVGWLCTSKMCRAKTFGNHCSPLFSRRILSSALHTATHAMPIRLSISINYQICSYFSRYHSICSVICARVFFFFIVASGEEEKKSRRYKVTASMTPFTLFLSICAFYTYVKFIDFNINVEWAIKYRKMCTWLCDDAYVCLSVCRALKIACAKQKQPNPNEIAHVKFK